MNETSRVEGVIERVMAAHPCLGKRAQAAYYEAVHQELAPLARDLECELFVAKTQVGDLAALVRRLVHALRKSAPDNDLPAKALDYLNRNGIPTTMLREVTEVQDT